MIEQNIIKVAQINCVPREKFLQRLNHLLNKYSIFKEISDIPTQITFYLDHLRCQKFNYQEIVTIRDFIYGLPSNLEYIFYLVGNKKSYIKFIILLTRPEEINHCYLQIIKFLETGQFKYFSSYETRWLLIQYEDAEVSLKNLGFVPSSISVYKKIIQEEYLKESWTNIPIFRQIFDYVKAILEEAKENIDGEEKFVYLAVDHEMFDIIRNIFHKSEKHEWDCYNPNLAYLPLISVNNWMERNSLYCGAYNVWDCIIT